MGNENGTTDVRIVGNRQHLGNTELHVYQGLLIHLVQLHKFIGFKTNKIAIVVTTPKNKNLVNKHAIAKEVNSEAHHI